MNEQKPIDPSDNPDLERPSAEQREAAILKEHQIAIGERLQALGASYVNAGRDEATILKERSSATLQRNLCWFVAAKQMSEVRQVDPKRAAFYMGMQMEELAEKVEAVMGYPHALSRAMQIYADEFKKGHYNVHMEHALRERPVPVLDGDLDLLWVTVGAAMAQGADVEGAYSALADANEDKRYPDGTYHLDPVTGKVLKPEGWRPPDLSPYLPNQGVQE